MEKIVPENEMNHKGRFTKIDKSEKRMYGPRGLLVCGYPARERRDFIGLADRVGLGGTRVVFATTRDLRTNIGDILCYESETGLKGESIMARAVVMSGLTRNELHRLLAAYRKAGKTPQIWATLTPISEKWPLEYLLNELQSEDRAMKKRPAE